MKCPVELISVILFAAGIALLCTGCGCARIDCAPAFDTLIFTYTDENGTDLLAGPEKNYDEEDLRLVVFGVDGEPLYSDVAVYEIGTDAAFAYAELRVNASRQYLEVLGTVTDTLDFSFAIVRDICCGEGWRITQILLNGELAADEGNVVSVVERG